MLDQNAFVNDIKAVTELAQWFERSRLTQRDFAQQLGITDGHLSRLIAGDRQASLPLAVRISELTGIPVAALVQKHRKAS